MDGAISGFIALRIDAGVATEVGRVAEAMARRAPGLGLEASWTLPSSYHLTLAYLGWMQPEARFAVQDVLDELAEAPPFSLALERIGAFPNLAEAKVLWAGVAPNEALTQLAQRVRSRCQELGFSGLDAPWVPHVTIGRLQGGKDAGALVALHADERFGQVSVEAMYFLESSIKSGEYDYRVIAQRPLGKPSSVRLCQRVPVQTSTYDAALATEDGWGPKARGATHDA